MESRVLLTFAVCLLTGLCSSTEIPIEEHQEEELKLPETVHLPESNDENLGLGGYDDKLGGYDDKLPPDHKHATSYQSFYLESKNPVPIVIKKEYHHEHKPVHHEYSYGSHENLVPQHDNSQFDYHGYQRR